MILPKPTSTDVRVNDYGFPSSRHNYTSFDDLLRDASDTCKASPHTVAVMIEDVKECRIGVELALHDGLPPNDTILLWQFWIEVKHLHDHPLFPRLQHQRGRMEVFSEFVGPSKPLEKPISETP